MPKPPRKETRADVPEAAQSARPSHASMPDQVKTILDSIRALVTTGFAIVGIAFLYANWSELTSLISHLNRFEFAGVKAEFGNKAFGDYQGQVPTNFTDKGRLTKEEYQGILYRGLYMQPVLAASTLLWVDDTPEDNNVEMQLLTALRINIRIARTTKQAMDELLNPKRKFDLVISDIDRRGEPEPEFGLSECSVRWFIAPKKEQEFRQKKLKKKVLSAEENRELLELVNKSANEYPEPGFYLAERMYKEMLAPIPPIIYYTAFNEPLANKCAITVTPKAYALMHSIFDQLERARWQLLARLVPPWVKDLSDKEVKKPPSPAEQDTATAKDAVQSKVDGGSAR